MRHSDLIGGSSAERRIQCTGSANLEAQFPNVTSPEARLGTALHALMYQCLDDPTWRPPRDRDATAVFTDHDEQGEEVDCVETIPVEVMEEKFWPCLDAFHAIIKRYKLKKLGLELECSLPESCGPEVFGTTDLAGRGGSTLVVADYKSGGGVQVSAAENFQLAFYAAGLVETKHALARGATKLVFVIVQPTRDGWESGAGGIPNADIWETDFKFLTSFRLALAIAYGRIKSGDVSYKSGKWCQFCRGRAACPEQNAILEKFERKHALMGKAPGGLTAVRLAELLSLGEQVVAQYKAVEDMATKLAVEGTRIPGYKLIESLGHRAFTEPKVAEVEAARLLGKQAFETSLRSPAQLEKLAKKLKVDFSPLEQFIHRPSRGGRLVKDSNPAPEMLVERGPIELPAEMMANVIDLGKKRDER